MKTRNNSYIIIVLIISILSGSCSGTKEKSTSDPSRTDRPNILILYMDDQGTLDAGCYGVSDLATPNIDRLAAEGILFTRAYAHTVCCPSRAALLTGRSPQRGGVNNWTSCYPGDMEGRNMSLDEVTLAEVLQEEGYRTALIGKWHLGARDDHGPLDQGFDYFWGFRGGFIDYYSHHFLHAGWQKPQFHDLYQNREEIFADGSYFPDMLVREAEEFISKNREDPFFLYLAFNLPHYPEQPDSTFSLEYEDLAWPRSSYAPMIATMDARIGQVVGFLEKSGLTDNTLIIYMSDNGHSTEDYYNWDVSYGGNGGGGFTGKWRGAKGSFFEGGIRVPCIVSYPSRFGKGEIRHQAITNMDFFPTICDLLKIPLPDVTMDGASILPILMDEGASSPHEVFHWMWQQMWAVQKDNWKLIYRGHDTTGKYANHPEKEFFMPEFYLARLDDENPEEINHASAFPEIVEQMQGLHEIWAEGIFRNSGYPDPNKVPEQQKESGKGSVKL